MKFKITSEKNDPKSQLISFIENSNNHLDFVLDRLGIKTNNLDFANVDYEWIKKIGAIVTNPGDIQLTRDEFIAGKKAFVDNYRDTINSATFYEDVTTYWEAFKTAALYAVDHPSALALRLIHRYDETSKKWYVTVEKLNMIPPADMTIKPRIYSLTSRYSFFDILPDGTITPLRTTSNLPTGGYGSYDPAYFNNVYYRGNTVVQGTHIQSVIYSWEEIKQLFCDNTVDNGIPITNLQFFKIGFTGVSRDASPDFSPHSIALYMIYNNLQLVINDNTVISTSFNGYGADYDTLCPPSPSYTWPTPLNWASSCF